MPAKLTIQEAERRFTDMVKGQKWRDSHSKYYFTCEIHGRYLQVFTTHNSRSGCPKCGQMRTAGACRLTIQEAEQRFPDMIKGQIWLVALTGAVCLMLYIRESS